MDKRTREEKKDAVRVVKLMYDKRQEWEPKWKEYREAFAPSRGRFDSGDDDRAKREREDRRNSNPYRIADEYAAGVQSGLVSPTRQWFTLTPFDKSLMRIDAVKDWIGELEAAMSACILQTNFYDQVVDFMKEQGVFGTAAMFIEEDEEDVFHCRTLTAGEYAIGTDNLGRVNRFCRKLSFTLSELIQEFGESNLPPQLKRDAKEFFDNSKGRDKKYEVVHLIQSNKKYDVFNPAAKYKRYQSLWWVTGYDEEHGFLRESGYEEMPVIIGRWKVVSGDIYGSEHPGQVALDDAKTLQDIEKDSRAALEHAVAPALAIPRSLMGRVNARPRGLTPYDPVANGGAPAITPLYEVTFDHAAAENKNSLLLRNIEQAFYIDLFRMWSTDLRIGRTATEIQAREDEKAYMLGPITLRQTAEVLDAAILRIFRIMLRANKLPDIPEELSGGDLRIEYMSEFSLLQKRAAQGGIETLLSFAAQLAQLQGATGEYPEVLDNIDPDRIMQAIADMHSLPVGVVRGEKMLMAKRQERAEQAEQAQQMQQAQQLADNAQPMADTMQTMSQTPITNGDGEQGSLLDSLLASAQDGTMNDVMGQMAEEINGGVGTQFGYAGP